MKCSKSCIFHVIVFNFLLAMNQETIFFIEDTYKDHLGLKAASREQIENCSSPT